MENEFLRKYIQPILKILYTRDALLFEHDLSERCIAFRFAHYLQNKFDELKEYDVYVDCDYNSHIKFEDGAWHRYHGKPLMNRDGDDATGRFIDIIVHRRHENKNPEYWSDLICFELKKWNNQSNERNNKDLNNLQHLTLDYGYRYGFHIVFGKTKENVSVEVFEGGQSPEKPFKLF